VICHKKNSTTVYRSYRRQCGDQTCNYLFHYGAAL
jgi:hypothetical protein